ncbi:MAG: hypothetical protein IKP28_00655 [Clostridia bacterium]|nr:hypothetical protein [Clostridia bacterium]
MKKGITLIALIITVIVLLIISGTAVSLGLGSDSIYEKTDNTVKKWNEKVDEENNTLNELLSFMPNPNVLSAQELYENASTYFGWDVTNYAETLPEELQDIEWQLLYAGPLEDETESRIYLISKKYVNYTQLPKKNNVSLVEVTNGSGKTAKFAGDDNSGMMLQYSGSSDITESKIKNLNKKYFNYLTNNNLTSTEPNIKAVAYMLDTDIWADYAGNYAEYAIGGPTVELLFSAYNQYKNLTGQNKFISDVNDKKGYTYTVPGTIESDTETKDNPFSVSNIQSNVTGYNIASPYGLDKQYIISIYSGGTIGAHSHYNSSGWAFRPVVVLNTGCKLEKVKNGNNDALRIVY